MNHLLERFLHYVSFDTQSRFQARQIPSSEGQWQLARVLQEELIAAGLEEVTLSESGCVTATLPANTTEPAPVIGFIAHMDTSPDFSGKHVRPQIVENYRGGDIALGPGDEVLSPVTFPVLHQLSGHTLITTDGKTLLGADDKAGIAEIMTALVRLKQENRPHGKIRVAFTPDEETGKGVSCFDVAAFGADWAYTVDGGGLGEFEFENFNAASATVKITGNNVHPGMAKGVMVNALDLAMRFYSELPVAEKPQFTHDREGFWHLHTIKGTTERAELCWIIRDFDRNGFAARKALLHSIAQRLNETLPAGCAVDVQIEDSYYNMCEEMEKHPHVIALALQAMRDCDIEPRIKPIRGGTDGASLTFRGLPCPNLFTGAYNFHGRHEFASLNNMEKAVEVIMQIARLAAQQ